MTKPFLGGASFASNMYVEIYCVNFTTSTRIWNGNDFSGVIALTQLDGASVKINNKSAYVYFISPGLIDVNVPEDASTGNVFVEVFTNQGPSNTVTVPRSRLSPALESIPQFNVAGKQYVVAFPSDFANFVGKPSLVQGFNFAARKPGEIILIYALGAGPTNPATQAGLVASANSTLSLPFQLKIGGVPASVPFAGLLAGTIRPYQLNVVIPNVTAADQTIEFIVDGIPNNQNLLISVGP